MARAESIPVAAEVARRLRRAGLELPDPQSEALARFLELLSRWNRVYNLTGIHDPNELVDRHLVESLALRPLLRGERVADIGTGAGLPGLPLAIAEPERAFTLIESRVKRVRFLRQVIADLGLRNTVVAHGRAEHLRPEQPFATVLARAVAPPAELLEICRNLTVPGSLLLMLTAAHLETRFAGLAPDFVPRAVELARGAPRLRSSIVMLERIDVETQR
jgi:16S rRNA (guanine527-N7)-methyltransferase